MLLLVSLVVSVLISKRYLKPVTEALDSIKTKSYSGDDKKNTYMEINDLMDCLLYTSSSIDESITQYPSPSGFIVRVFFVDIL